MRYSELHSASLSLASFTKQPDVRGEVPVILIAKRSNIGSTGPR